MYLFTKYESILLFVRIMSPQPIIIITCKYSTCACIHKSVDVEIFKEPAVCFSGDPYIFACYYVNKLHVFPLSPAWQCLPINIRLMVHFARVIEEIAIQFILILLLRIFTFHSPPLSTAAPHHSTAPPLSPLPPPPLHCTQGAYVSSHY